MALNTELPIHQLIGAPIVALIQAESAAAQASASFIETFGFSGSKEGDSFGHLRSVTFTYTKQDVNGKDVTEEIQLPVLSLVPIPLLQIKDATFDFSLKITNTDEPRETKKEEEKLVQLKGIFGKKPAGNDHMNQDVDINMKINIVQSDIPVGLSRLFNILELGFISRVPETRKK